MMEDKIIYIIKVLDKSNVSNDDKNLILDILISKYKDTINRSENE